eukprot:1777555-Amphidinium_carterae.1
MVALTFLVHLFCVTSKALKKLAWPCAGAPASRMSAQLSQLSGGFHLEPHAGRVVASRSNRVYRSVAAPAA